jgi:hypothetical protein
VKFNATVIRGQGVTFAVVIVRSHVLRSLPECTKAQLAFAPAFPGLPIVLMAQDSRGSATFHGRKDIVGFLSSLDLDAIKWRVYANGK